MDVLAAEHLLIDVIGLVRGHEAGARLPLGDEVGGFAMKVLKKSGQLGGRHALCFALQVMQTRVHGIAFSRASAMGSPQSRQIP